MMIFRFTKYAQDKFKLPKLPQEKEEKELFNEWYVSVFYSERKKYIITTNAKTLYSIIMIGTGISDDSLYFSSIFQEMSDQMKVDNLEFVYNRYIQNRTTDVILSKTNSRSILGSMNDFINQAQYLLKYFSVREVSLKINESPMNYLKMNNPIISMEEYKECI